MILDCGLLNKNCLRVMNVKEDNIFILLWDNNETFLIGVLQCLYINHVYAKICIILVTDGI